MQHRGGFVADPAGVVNHAGERGIGHLADQLVVDAEAACYAGFNGRALSGFSGQPLKRAATRRIEARNLLGEVAERDVSILGDEALDLRAGA